MENIITKARNAISDFAAQGKGFFQSPMEAISSLGRDVPRVTQPIQQKPAIPDYQSWTPQTPYDKHIENIFGDKANQAKQVLLYRTKGGQGGENMRFLSGIEADKYNAGTQTIDRGLYRINNATFRDFMKRKPEELHNAGIYTWADMLNPVKNIKMAKIIYDEQGWGAWYAAPNWLKE